MSVRSSRTLLTPEQLLNRSDQVRFELIEGKLKERNVGVLSRWIGSNLARLLGNRAMEANLGWVLGSDNGCQCFDWQSDTMRRPDVCFIKANRLSADQLGDGWLKLVPDLVVEVISPRDKWEDGEKKLELFLKAGIPLIWVVSPLARTVRLIRSDGTGKMLREGDQLSGEDIVPGFVCEVSAIFPPKVPVVVPTP